MKKNMKKIEEKIFHRRKRKYIKKLKKYMKKFLKI